MSHHQESSSKYKERKFLSYKDIELASPKHIQELKREVCGDSRKYNRFDKVPTPRRRRKITQSASAVPQRNSTRNDSKEGLRRTLSFAASTNTSVQLLEHVHGSPSSKNNSSKFHTRPHSDMSMLPIDNLNINETIDNSDPNITNTVPMYKQESHGKQNELSELSNLFPQYQLPLRLKYNSINTSPGSPSKQSKSLSKALQDSKMLAKASSRASKSQQEGKAYCRIGDIYLELGNPEKAIAAFKRFLLISQRANDITGQSLALSNIGVTYQEMGMIRDDSELLEKAIGYFQKQFDVANIEGLIIGHINIGIAESLLGKIESAIENHNQALQYAIEVQDHRAESIALANLGSLGEGQGDVNAAKSFMERHLDLSLSMKDSDASSDAYHQLGMLASSAGEYEEADKLFGQAREMAQNQGNQKKENQIKCDIARLKGDREFESVVENFAKQYKNTL
eukprot:gb/GECH01009721.1/.p1 GENE.gb/GECH01009721.1/~~gb/GECH01009721.1/.p1  ORF type:complete len:453 (+),score=94.69 gb/GECH01009721.1/:1-1359(+)